MLGECAGMLGCEAQHGALVLGDVYGAIWEREKLSNWAGCASGPSQLGYVWCLHSQGWLCAHISPAQTHTQSALQNNVPGARSALCLAAEGWKRSQDTVQVRWLFLQPEKQFLLN